MQTQFRNFWRAPLCRLILLRT